VGWSGEEGRRRGKELRVGQRGEIEGWRWRGGGVGGGGWGVERSVERTSAHALKCWTYTCLRDDFTAIENYGGGGGGGGEGREEGR
jgi:hypothetical protein